MNRFRSDEAGAPRILRVGADLEAKQIERLRALRRARDESAVSRALERIEAAAHGDENLVPPILEAVEALGTVGEISGRLRAVFGEFHETFAV